MRHSSIPSGPAVVCLAVLVSVAYPTAALAGDTATVEFIGFSRNGRYLAFEQYGIRDGAGYPYSELRFVDVQRNDFVGKRISAEAKDLSDDQGEEEVRRAVRAKAAPRMKKLGIQHGRVGDRILLEPKNVGIQQTEQSFTVGKTSYRLVVKAPQNEEPDCPEGTSTPLEVLVEAPASKRVQVLQRDAAPPSWRACAQAIRPYEAYLFEDKWLVVFLEVLVPAFEGPATRYMAVTGKLP